MNLRDHIPLAMYRGVAVFSDVHADLPRLRKGLDYAREHSLFPLFIGDLLDGGDKPFETISIVKALLDAQAAALVIGNHDDKFYRWAIGNPVILKGANLRTIEDVPDGRLDEFRDMLLDIFRSQLSSDHFRFGRVVFVHGALHPKMWEETTMDREAKAFALYGEVNGERDEDDFPVRLYSWTEAVPEGHMVVVGHDRNPMGTDIVGKAPVKRTNPDGGTVLFTDTGSGKGGTLSVVHFDFDEADLDLIYRGHETF